MDAQYENTNKYNKNAFKKKAIMPKLCPPLLELTPTVLENSPIYLMLHSFLITLQCHLLYGCLIYLWSFAEVLDYKPPLSTCLFSRQEQTTFCHQIISCVGDEAASYAETPRWVSRQHQTCAGTKIKFRPFSPWAHGPPFYQKSAHDVTLTFRLP